MKLPTRFPGVNERPVVTRLEFTGEGISIEGRFELNEFALLESESLEFLRLYIKVRGNLKEVERILGVSYPTVRVRFDVLLQNLGYEPDAVTTDLRDEVLTALEKGQVNVDEAIKKLKR